GEAIAAADDAGNADGRIREIALHIDTENVLIERLAKAAGFFGAVEYCDGGHAFRDGIEKRFGGERAEEADFQERNFFAEFLEGVDGLFRGASAGAHQNDEAVGIGGAVVIEEAVVAAGTFAEAVHHLLHNGGAGAVKGIAGFAGLEENVGILRGAAKHGAIGRQRAFAVLANKIVVDDGVEFVVAVRIDP